MQRQQKIQATQKTVSALWSRLDSTGGQILLTALLVLLLLALALYYRNQEMPSKATGAGQKASVRNQTLTDFTRRLTE